MRLEELQSDPRVKQFLAAFTPKTAKCRLKFLYAACRAGFSLDALDWGEERYKRAVVEAVMRYAAAGKNATAMHVQQTLKMLWEHVHGAPLWFPRAQRVRYRPAGEDVVPTAEQVFMIAEAAERMAGPVTGARNRAAILSLLASGVRLNCLLRWDWKLLGGLRDDVATLRITRRYDSKLAGAGYVTFLAPWAVEALRRYVKRRMFHWGWRPQPDDPVFATRTGKRLHENAVRQALRKASVAAIGAPIHPHALRKAFSTHMSNAGVPFEAKETMMGHRLPGVASHYYYQREDVLKEFYLRAWSGVGLKR